MTDFIWPSDQARAENDELNRVCEYLEEVLDELDALTEKLAESDHALMQLGRLKARWQADAVSEYAFLHLGGYEQELAEIYAGKLRRQAEARLQTTPA